MYTDIGAPVIQNDATLLRISLFKSEIAIAWLLGNDIPSQLIVSCEVRQYIIAGCAFRYYRT